MFWTRKKRAVSLDTVAFYCACIAHTSNECFYLASSDTAQGIRFHASSAGDDPMIFTYLNNLLTQGFVPLVVTHTDRDRCIRIDPSYNDGDEIATQGLLYFDSRGPEEYRGLTYVDLSRRGSFAQNHTHIKDRLNWLSHPFVFIPYTSLASCSHEMTWIGDLLFGNHIYRSPASPSSYMVFDPHRNDLCATRLGLRLYARCTSQPYAKSESKAI